MSIYLRGVCSSLPFYLSKHIWCAVAGASNRNVCFPEDACSLFIHFCCALCCMAIRCQTKERPPVRNGEISPAALLKVRRTVFHSHWHVQYMLPINTIFKPLLSKAATFHVLQTAGTPVEPLHFIHLSMLLPRHLMWQPVLKGALIAVTPMGVRGTYLCCSRQLSLRIM